MRKIFVPLTGGFARYLEIFSNPTGVSITAQVEVGSNLGSDGRTRIVVAPSVTNNTFAVTAQNDRCCDPALAHIFGEPTAPVAVIETRFVDGDDNIFYRWNMTIPADQTVILMHFAVQRDVLDTAGAQAQAEELVDLTDPNALVGMSLDEKSHVLNFNIPSCLRRKDEIG